MLTNFNIRERTGWTGRVQVQLFDAESGALVFSSTKDNLITDDGLDLLIDALIDGSDAQIKYVAFGSDGTAPAAADTQLGTELGRVAVASTDGTGADGVGVTVANFETGDANGVVQEVGFFGGAGASATADSGVLIARVLNSFTKDATVTATVTRTDTLARG